MDVGSKSPIGIAQRVFGRPSVSLRTLPNIGPTFLQRDGVLRGAGLLARGALGTGREAAWRVGADTSPGAYVEDLTCAGWCPDGCAGAQVVVLAGRAARTHPGG